MAESNTTTAPAVETTADVLKLLDSLQNVTPSDIAVAETQKIQVIEPPKELIEPWEPDYVEGHECKTPSGHVILDKHVYRAYVRGENIHLLGPSGNGKSAKANHMLDLANKPIRDKNILIYEENAKALKAGAKEDELEPYIDLPYKRSILSCFRQMRSEHLIGTLKFRTDEAGNRECYVVGGAVVQAWTEGRTLIVEEMDFAQPDVWAECHAFFDGRTKSTTIYVNGPEDIHKNARFRMIATSNTRGRGEDEMKFAGTQPQNDAFLNRFTFTLEVPWLKPEAEVEVLLRKTGIAKDQAKKMVDIANEIRTSEEEGCITHTVSTRDLMSWARECLDEEKSSGRPTNLTNWWSRIAVRSAYSAFLARIENENTLETMGRFINVS